MASGSVLIEKLLSYASENLYLSEQDVGFKRLVLCRLLNTDPSLVTEKFHQGCKLPDLKKDVAKHIE